jgi:hypothetical protein
MVRQTCSGPARGNGNSSKPAVSPAAAHNFACDFHDVGCIQGRVYSIGRREGSEARQVLRRLEGAGVLRLSLRIGASAKNTAADRETRYNFPMALASFGLRVLEAMFFFGLVGSSVVVLISFVEDAKELFGKD